MALIRFTANYQDLSTDRGFQFKFMCDKCNNGYMTRFQTSITGGEAGSGISIEHPLKQLHRFARRTTSRLCALCDLRPGVFQANRAIEHRLAGN